MSSIRSKRSRYSLAVGVGVISSALVGWFTSWPYAPLAGWDAAALVIVLVIAWDMRGASSSITRTTARRDDMNHSLIDIIAILASLASLGAVIYLLASGDRSLERIVFGLVSIVISWTTVHMLYALRYAAMYYRDVEGGVDFGGNKPRFTDFVYLAYTIGMTYQVSDTTLQTSEFRRVAIGHALLSFVFGTAIIATTINFLVSLSK